MILWARSRPSTARASPTSTPSRVHSWYRVPSVSPGRVVATPWAIRRPWRAFTIFWESRPGWFHPHAAAFRIGGDLLEGMGVFQPEDPGPPPEQETHGPLHPQLRRQVLTQVRIKVPLEQVTSNTRVFPV